MPQKPSRSCLNSCCGLTGEKVKVTIAGTICVADSSSGTKVITLPACVKIEWMDAMNGGNVIATTYTTDAAKGVESIIDFTFNETVPKYLFVKCKEYPAATFYL